jgi:hypothetical protein
MTPFTLRQRVFHKPTGQSGIIVTLFNLGKLGDFLSTTGARFIVFREDCQDQAEPPDPFADLERLLPEGRYWLSDRRYLG